MFFETERSVPLAKNFGILSYIMEYALLNSTISSYNQQIKLLVVKRLTLS